MPNKFLASLDQLDKKVSRPIQQLQLGPLEYLLMVPGSWFGLPSMYVTVCAALIGLAADPSWEWVGVSAGIFLVMLVMFCQVVIFKSWNWKLLRSRLDFVYLGVFCVLSKLFASSRAHQAMLLFGLTMLAAQLPTLVVKIFSSRVRPVIAEKDWLNTTTTPRLVPIHKFVDNPKEARESFPSGDAVGAGVFYGVIAFFTQNLLWLLPVFITLFGRVYFWAHHIGDVSVGGALGVAVAALLHLLCGGVELTIWHFAVSLPPFLVCYSKLAKLRGGHHHPEHDHALPKIPKVD